MMGGWMWIWIVVFWAALIAGGVWLIRLWTRGSDRADAFDMLRRRLARGEIDVREFEQREATLRRGGPGSRVPLVAILVAVTLLIVLPAVIVVAGGWDMDMRGMHGGGQDTTGEPVVRGDRDVNVRIEDFAFEPGNLEVPVGAAVTWTNADSVPHDATSRSGDWRTNRLSSDESDALSFENAGTYDYYCSIHPGMKARLVVR